MRFLFPGGNYTLKFEGTGIDLSAVGKGTLKVTGKSAFDDGTVAVERREGHRAAVASPPSAARRSA